MERMGDGRFLESLWYVAPWSREVRVLEDEPFTRRILDVPVLMYRTGDGTAVAMDDDPPDYRQVNLRVGQGPIAARRMIEKLLAKQQAHSAPPVQPVQPV